MTKPLLLPTVIASMIGTAAIALLLFAWHLPPFSGTDPYTENAYLRGKVTTIAPQLSGYLSEVDVVDFQTVHQGDLIARIDDTPYKQKLAQAEAALQNARTGLEIARQTLASSNAELEADQAGLDSAKAALATAESNARRSSALSQRGATSQQTADQVELALQQAQATVRQAEAQIAVRREAILTASLQIEARQSDIAQATAALELARNDLAHTKIRAPADGRLGQVSARLGQYVAAGTALVSHVGTDLWVIANFKETEIDGIHIGDRVHLRVDALSGKTFTGTVEAFSPATASEFSMLAGSNATGNFTKIAQRLPVRIRLDRGQSDLDRLAPGLSVEATVRLGTHSG